MHLKNPLWQKALHNSTQFFSRCYSCVVKRSCYFNLTIFLWKKIFCRTFIFGWTIITTQQWVSHHCFFIKSENHRKEFFRMCFAMADSQR